MTVLVTGGTGMLGSAVVRRLLSDGEEVVVADLDPTPYFLRGRSVAPDSVLVETLNIADAEAVARLFDQHRFSAVIHLAAAVSSLCNKDAVAGALANCVGTALILEECCRHDVARVALASSIAVYGHDPEFDLDTLPSVAHRYAEGPPRFSPHSVTYGAGKGFLEALASDYADRRGLETAGMRCAFIASAGRPSRPPLGVVSGYFVDAAALGRPVEVENGRSVLPYVYVEDVARQFTTLISADAKLLRRGPFFNTGALTCTVTDVVDVVLDLIPDAQITLGDGAVDLVLGNPKSYSDALFADTFGPGRQHDLRAGVAAQIAEARRWPDL